MCYEIKLEGRLADRKPTFKGALALVTLKFHGKTGITIEKGGSVVWRTDKN